MGDFIIDFRDITRRSGPRVSEQLRFLPHVEPVTISLPGFDLTLTLTEDPHLWSPYRRPDGSRITAIAGRVALPETAWNAGESRPGTGGLACKALDALVEVGGLEALERVSGNFAIIVADLTRNQVHVVTDCTGVYPVFETEAHGAPVLSSHTDTLADATSNAGDLDQTSLGEFLLTGTVSPPHTFYRRLRAVGRAMALTVTLAREGRPSVQRRCYLPLEFMGRDSDREDDLAAEFARAFRNSVQLRSQPRLGRVAVALSGGLDSRAVLASLHPSADCVAFTCFDEENAEFRTASAIAKAAGVTFLPYRRSEDYYAENARLGVRINGGMGSFANNHFLGALPWLRGQGGRMLLTGCYCDYLYKGLPLNRRTHPITGREELGPFDPEFYFTHVWPDTKAAKEARDRLVARYDGLRTDDRSDAAVFALEAARTFPLAYEGDNAQRVVPQRLTGWCVPVSDPELMRLYCRIPYRFKLNKSLFSKAVRSLTGAKYDAIPDANTGARVGANWWTSAATAAALRLKNRLIRLRGGHATQGSWPNWLAYASRSPILAGFWNSRSGLVQNLLPSVLGNDASLPGLGKGSEREMWLQLQILTLNVWSSARAGTTS
ncbi:MAG: asparagine synthase-related protein [Limisphaerales bacterium]